MDFDEFRAVTKRQKGSKLVENNNVSSTGNDEEVSTSKDNELSKGDTGNSESTKDNDLLAQLKNDEQSTSSKSNSKGKSKKDMLNTGNAISSSINFITTYITNIVEQNEIQALYVGVLMIDTFCAFALLVFSFGGSANNEQRNNFGDASSINANAASMKFDDSELSRDLNALTSQLRNVLAAIYSFFVLENGYQHPFIQYVCIPTLQSICLFSLLFFCVEILLVLVAFQTRVLSHVGYMLDMVILSMQFYETVGLLPSMIQSNTSGMITYRLFNLVRCWRFFRLYTIYINIEVSKHMKTKRLLEDKVKDNKAMEIDRFRLENDLRKEKESLNAVETMLQNYKEEVFTLNEALKIAALDIAEIAQTDENEVDVSDLSALEDVDDETLAQMSEEDLMKLMESIASKSATDKTSINNTLNQLQSTLQAHDTAHKKGSNVEQVYSQVKKDAVNDETRKSKGSKSSTFIVGHDGSYNQN